MSLQKRDLNLVFIPLNGINISEFPFSKEFKSDLILPSLQRLPRPFQRPTKQRRLHRHVSPFCMWWPILPPKSRSESCPGVQLLLCIRLRSENVNPSPPELTVAGCETSLATSIDHPAAILFNVFRTKGLFSLKSFFNLFLKEFG